MRLLLLSTAAVLALSPRTAAAQASRTRVYYIAADEVMWDYAPTGMDQITGIPIDSARPGLKRPGRLGRVFRKAVYREYTDSTFRTLRPRPPEWEHLGLLGPVLRAVVGDTLRVVFRNNGSHPYSMHPHGVFYQKSSEGTPYRDGTTGADRADDAVAAGGTHTYVWAVPERAGPGPGDGSSVMWMYHSHVDEGKDVTAGLMGPILVTARGQAQADGRPQDVDREFVVNFAVYPEAMSHYFRDNIALRMPWANADSLAQDDAFGGGAFFDTMNGFIWGNMPVMTANQGERVRWYVMASTTEFDFHTPHWHGMTVLAHHTRMDIVSVEPMMMVVADMETDNPGVWLFHCHLKVHLEGGMAARFAVLPTGDAVARARLEEAIKPVTAQPDPFLAAGARLPGQWRSRPDAAATRPEFMRLVAMDGGLHATMGPSGVFFDSTRVARGAYRARASFTQTRRSEHPEALGLILGGQDLAGPGQSYLYFMVRQDGKYLIKHRAGSETHTLMDWTAHGAIRTVEGDSAATNALAVDVSAEGARFLVNGMEVVTLPRTVQLQTDGVVGLRINHNLDVHVADFGVEALPVGRRGSR